VLLFRPGSSVLHPSSPPLQRLPTPVRYSHRVRSVRANIKVPAVPIHNYIVYLIVLLGTRFPGLLAIAAYCLLVCREPISAGLRKIRIRSCMLCIMNSFETGLSQNLDLWLKLFQGKARVRNAKYAHHRCIQWLGEIQHWDRFVLRRSKSWASWSMEIPRRGESHASCTF
jgi:hypothetical protein